MTFADFMAEALYGPDGYYQKSAVIGAAGDFVTASGSLLFAQTLCRYVIGVWRAYGAPARLQVVELGAGEGTLAFHLCKAIAEWMKREPLLGVDYVIVEPSETLRRRQQARLATLAMPSVRVRWGTPSPLEDTVLIANEVLDALPVERLRRTPDGWEQAYVSWHPGGPPQVWWEPASAALAAKAERWLNIPVGTEAELCLGYRPLFEGCTGYGRRIAALWFDYGITKAEWESGVRPFGTLRAYRGQQWVDWQQCAGACDMTADVHWDLAQWEAGQAGWQVRRLWSQGEFLLAQGILDFVQPLADDGAARSHALARFKQTAALKQLILPGGMGERFSCLECWWDKTVNERCCGD